ncbi:MAG: hypothetical protein IPK58_00285 [Acidobacteria bacterium]|nr:hypothetical protein [Acidobacteriota bacterium]
MKNLVVTAGYFGSKGTNLIGSFEKNLIEPGKAIALGPTGCAVGASTTPTAPCQLAGQAFFSSAASAILDQIRPYRGYRAITAVEPRYNSNYHSLQATVTKRFTGASQINASYTWSKNLTDNQNDRSASPQNTYNIAADRARAALDRRHILSINYIYELPWFDKQQGFVGKVLGGWQLSGIITYNTGLPFTPTVSGFDPAGLGLIPPPTTVARPNMLCDPNEGAPRTPQQWFNTACFQFTPTSNDGSFQNIVGSGGRGTVFGPSTKRIDFTLTKNLTFGERYRVQLRAEAFNILNTVNFRGLSVGTWTRATAPVANGGTCVSGCSTFGQALTVRDPRVLQFGAKFSF